MKFDSRLVTGVLIGMIIGLHYHASLMVYMPLLVIAGLVLLLKTLHH